LEATVDRRWIVTLVVRTYSDNESEKRKFPQVITIASEMGSGDLEWLTKGLLARCPVLYSLGKEILERIRAEFPPSELKKELDQYSHEYKNVGGPADNFWTVTTQPYGTFAAAHGHEDPQPCLKFSLYGSAEQEKVHDRFEGELATKEPGTFGASYCELKVYAAADIPALMRRLHLAYDLKVKGGQDVGSA
jgi:hypothetical protein